MFDFPEKREEVQQDSREFCGSNWQMARIGVTELDATATKGPDTNRENI